MRALAHLGPARRTRTAIAPVILLIGCSVPPDDYLGIVDTTTWDARFGGTTSSVAPLCVVPQTAVKNDSSATWYYAGNFSLRLLDPLNTQDPTRPLPTRVLPMQMPSPPP